MRRARVVIGALFGDEGKGLVTDAYAAEGGRGALVIRFNGGAQAGHTVTTPDGRRHVFSHVGAGSFAGARTWLSRFFVSNPLVFVREMRELAALGVVPEVLADPDGLVTTPWDMMINQFVENARAGGRHGSVGLGFGETIERGLHPAFATRVRDLDDPAALRPRLDAIRRDWVPRRLARLGFPEIAAAQADLLLSDAVLERWLEEAAAFAATIRPAGIEAVRAARDVIFEGAQGLLLDQDRGFFPHVTRSNTGIRNVVALAEEAGIGALDVTYAARAYMTRHGAGPLPGELPDQPYAGIRDETNRPHRFQGSLRFALLDLDLLAGAVHADLSDAPRGLRVSHRLVVSCLDQVGPEAARWIEGGAARRGSAEALAVRAAAAVKATGLLAGAGPSRETLGPLAVPA
jgi:adenylosuccinate synthase